MPFYLLYIFYGDQLLKLPPPTKRLFTILIITNISYIYH